MIEIRDRFVLGERIGGGDATDVYRALDRKLGHGVVLRLVRPEIVGDEYVERVQREAEAASDIRHPNVVAILDHGLIEGRPFVVHEVVDGRTLEDVLAQRRVLPEAEALDIAEQIARGLEAAHERGVLHRDLNTGNVLIARDGTAKIVDFGMPSTPRHPAPEQAERSTIDERADVYGLGAVLYHMLTGRVPRGRPVPPRRLAKRLSKATDGVVMRALESDPALRFPTAAAIGDALRLRKTAEAPPKVPAAPAALTVPPTEHPALVPPPPPAKSIERPVVAQPRVEPRVAAPSLRPSGPPTPIARAASEPGRLDPPLRRERIAPVPIPLKRSAAAPDVTERIARPQRSRGPARRDLRAALLALLAFPLLLVLLIGASALARPRGTDTAVLSATTTPVATATPEASAPPSPVATLIPPVETTPEPTAAPVVTPVPPPPVVAPPPQPPAPVVPVPPNAASATVRSFYELVAQKRFDEAAALWSPRMKANYPPSTNINGRFDRTRQIVIRSITPVPSTTGGATVAIDILEVLDSGVTRRWVGEWHLVWDGARWLMDAPSLRLG